MGEAPEACNPDSDVVGEAMVTDLVQALERLSDAARALSERAAGGPLTIRSEQEAAVVRAIDHLSALFMSALQDQPGEQLPCESCDETDRCQAPCKGLKLLLPASGAGRSRHESLFGDFNHIRTTERSAGEY